jgi:hypothetical protein
MCGNIVYSYMKAEKWDIVETIPGTGEGEIKENDGGGEFDYDTLWKLL